jgi:hypothetical protein
MKLEEMRKVLEEVRYLDWRFHIVGDDSHFFLQLAFVAGCCARPGREDQQYGRKWILSKHMTRSELVQTALKAVLTAVEHEAREQFSYRGQAIFGPHHDVEALVELCEARRQDVRQPA